MPIKTIWLGIPHPSRAIFASAHRFAISIWTHPLSFLPTKEVGRAPPCHVASRHAHRRPELAPRPHPSMRAAVPGHAHHHARRRPKLAPRSPHLSSARPTGFLSPAMAATPSLSMPPRFHCPLLLNPASFPLCTSVATQLVEFAPLPSLRRCRPPPSSYSLPATCLYQGRTEPTCREITRGVDLVR